MFNMVFMFQGGDALFFAEAFAGIPIEIRRDAKAEFFDCADIDQQDAEMNRCREALKSAGFAYLSVHGGLPYFQRFNQLQEEFLGRLPWFINSGIEEETAELRGKSSLPAMLYQRLESYRFAGGVENYRNFILTVLKEIGGFDCEPEAARIPQWEGLYRLPPDCSEEDYLARIRDERDRGEKPVAGILLHFHNVQHHNTRHIDALMESLRAKGALPLALYTNIVPSESYRGLRGSLEKYMLHEGKPLIDVLIVCTGHSLSVLSAPGSGTPGTGAYTGNTGLLSVFAPLDVPVLQAMYTFFTDEQWRDSPAGLDAMLLASNVYQPEFDGQLITLLIAYTQAVETPFGPDYCAMPIPDRVDKAARLALNWARLRRKPMAERKVALILHNIPPRADMIGCAYGLDTPASVYALVSALAERGLSLEYSFTDGKDIIDRICAGLTNDGRFLSGPELRERSAALLGEALWGPWFAALSPQVQGELRRDWGEAPGECMALDREILIPGIINGKLFIGLQPPRNFEDKAEEAYHSTDMVCPWQYLAFYRWLEDSFGADVVVHIGTHGTLEWLPGKEIGLSRDCYPDIALGTLPHLYPYIINVPGEGAQAKRRSAAAIIDHLIPSMTESGLYGPLEDIDEHIGAYFHAKQNKSANTEVLAAKILELALKQDLLRDIDLTEARFMADSAAGIDALHRWISGIRGSKIKDGLHIFGAVPQGARYTNMLRLLVFTRNGPIPSLREGLCALFNEDLEALLDAPAALGPDGRTNAMVLEEIDNAGRELFRVLEESGFSPQGIDAALEALPAHPQGSAALLRDCLEFAAQEIKPRLDATGDELSYFIRGVEGRFIPPGPSGSPGRGSAAILPTGRNFFMIDPAAVPSRAAWESGKRLAMELLERCRLDTGGIPEHIAIVVYAGDTIKTGGDDIAEILFLYGVRPVWLGDASRVIGLEAIALEELGRPRIDVTLRISGLFRDTFPNLIERIEDAVNLVAALPEAPEQNLVRKHVLDDLALLSAQGLGAEEARSLASLRVFGCPPGTYGAGVDIMVNSKKWESPDDLGRAYSNWSAHGYSRAFHGNKLPQVFSRRLASCDVTVKNIPSHETDMLDDDDFYNYHGGLISAVKAVKGAFPASYSVDGTDPEHPQTRGIHEEASRIMRARIQNPQWIAGLKEHGFRGAQEFSAMVDIVFGWDATSGIIDDWMYESIAQTYLQDGELRRWIQEVNPWALYNISGRLLEAAQRGLWNPKEDTLSMLRELYLDIEGALEGR
jgi:cobaltochelatase CobN